MSTYKKIILTDSGIKSGPTYDVYTSSDCSTYTFLQTVTLANIGDSVLVLIPNGTTCIKLVNTTNCNNSVSHNLPNVSLGDFSIDFNQLDFN